MTDVLLVGDDKLVRRLLVRLRSNFNVVIALDHSSNLKRIIKLVICRKLPLRILLKMAWAEWLRPDYPRMVAPIIRSNAMLLKLIHECGARKVYLFRAGLIINSTLLTEDMEILNVHCSRLPEYDGLCALDRAMQDGALRQCATLHRVTTKIDAGEVLQTRPFQLDPSLTYADNEERAYEAGIELLVGVLSVIRLRPSITCDNFSGFNKQSKLESKK